MKSLKRAAVIILVLFGVSCQKDSSDSFPVVVNTWGFTKATQRAWEVVQESGRSAIDSIEAGCSMAEALQVDGTVGWGGSPDEVGESTLDAMIMDGPTHDVGAVANLHRVKSAISVARKVLEHTKHSMLVGESATNFALQMGFVEEDISSENSTGLWQTWRDEECQPNFWKNVVPDPNQSCGPYVPVDSKDGTNDISEYLIVGKRSLAQQFDRFNHDTIGMIVIDRDGRIGCGTSTNGAKFKIPGRVGDSAIIGSGCYVDQLVGGATATGDGDILMRFSPSAVAVEYMSLGFHPSEAARIAISRIAVHYPMFSGALVTMNIKGEYGASCYGFKDFEYSVVNPALGDVVVNKVPCDGVDP